MQQKEIDANKKVDYDSLLKDETVQALLTHLNISTNIQTILYNESVLHILTACRSNKIQLGDKLYKKRARNYTTYEYLLGQNQDYHQFIADNPNDLKQQATKRLQLYSDVFKYTYGLSDINIIKENFEMLQPIAEGELYKIINNYWNDWEMQPILDSLNKILRYTEVKLQQNVNEREKQEKKLDKLLEGHTAIKLDENRTLIKDEEHPEGQIIINKDNEIIIS